MYYWGMKKGGAMRLRSVLILGLISSNCFSQTPSSIKDPATAGHALRPEQKQFALKFRQLQPLHTLSTDPSGSGLLLDLHDSTLYGKLYAGQAYFESNLADYPEVTYRTNSDIVQGKAKISLKTYFDPAARANANGWVDRGILGYRMEITNMRGGKPAFSGIFDSRVFFQRRDSLFVPIVSIMEPPMVGLIESDHPSWMIVSFTADRPCRGLIEVEKGGVFRDENLSERHDIRVGGLRPSAGYRYRAIAVDGPDTAATPWLHFRTAPPKGEGSVLFAYAGDGRAASGGGEYDYVGVDRQVGMQIARHAFRHGAAFLLFGGDLVGGYTNSIDEMRMEQMAFRETYASLLSARPLYSAIGNHEALTNAFDDGSQRGIVMDKWPYESSSAEAFFSSILVQPANGPKPGPGRPPYDETVFSFQYGPVKVIVFNTNYWFTTNSRTGEFGGCPEGYVLPEQVEWIRSEVRKGDADPTVRYIVMLAHSPLFAGGGHVSGSLWYNGNNNLRAYSLEGGTAAPLGPGLIDVRNELWKIACRSRKVALVLGSHEHNYQRILITKDTPVGVPSKDDLNGNGLLDDGRISPDPDFTKPLWQVISGGAGAPYYTEEKAPWSGSSKFFTALYHYILFRADRKRISMEVYSHTGQLLDRVEDLMAVRR